MNISLGFILADTARLMRKRFDLVSRESGVTGPQWRALLNIHHFPGMSQSALADRLDVEPITTSRMIDRLEQAGMVERRRDPDDRRIWQLYLTPAAAPLIDILHSEGSKLTACALHGFDERESALLAGFLARMRDNLAGERLAIEETAHHG